MSAPDLHGEEFAEHAADLSALIALQPVMDLQDRTVFGYEALPRGSLRYDARDFVPNALAAVQYTSPALLFVPLARELLEDEDFDPFAEARDLGRLPERSPG